MILITSSLLDFRLNDNYEMEDGVSLPRSSLYTHYMDFCVKNTILPVNAASFGKVTYFVKNANISKGFDFFVVSRVGIKYQTRYYRVIHHTHTHVTRQRNI